MNLLQLALSVHDADEPRGALQVVADGLASEGGIACAAWLHRDAAEIACAGGSDWTPSDRLLDEIRAADAVVTRKLRSSEGPAGQTSELLSIRIDEASAALALIAPAGSFGEGPAFWRPVGRAVAAVAERDSLRAAASAAGDRIEELEIRLTELRRNLEEGEVLHTLGVAANRSLDPDEVLELVARLTRTALGASYVMLSTADKGAARTPAAAGLRHEAPERDPLADRLFRSGKTIRLGEGETVRPDQFEVHAEEGMVVGLGVPLSLYGETIGGLVIGYRRALDLTPRHVRLALTLAGHAAVAISNAQLHRALATRTAEAERAYEELRWGAAEKERFFAALSHELRTPLNSVLGYQSLVIDGVAGEVPPEVRRLVESAHRAASGLLHLVSDVLDLSKIEAGMIELKLEPVAVIEFLHDAVAAVQPIADQKGLEVVLDARSNLPAVITDVNRARQILVNLLSNAIKFTPQGQVRVSGVVSRGGIGDAVAEGFVQIQVRDTGPGIPDREQERIFHEFVQIGDLGASAGTGLGLPISRKLARLLGGELRVQSRVGEGSTFTLTLPLAGPEA